MLIRINYVYTQYDSVPDNGQEMSNGCQKVLEQA